MKLVLGLANLGPPHAVRIPPPGRKPLAHNPGVYVRGRVDGHPRGTFGRNESGQAIELGLSEVDEAKVAVQSRVGESVAAGGAVNPDRDHDRSFECLRTGVLTTSV